MKEKLLHTPEGVRDIYNSECERKLGVVNHIHHVLEMYSYHDIETPTFEFFDIFNMEKGSAASNEMFKFFDRNNNTLVLRPDMTPSIARCAAKYFADEKLPIRLCYKGNTFTNKPLHQGKLSENTQVGCELINDDSSAADAEIIACVIDCLKATGLNEFQIEIGQVEYFKGLMQEAGLDSDTEEKIREFILIKNFFGLQEYVKTLNISDSIKQAILEFDSLFGELDMLDKAASFVSSDNKMSLEAVERLKKVYTALTYYGYEKYINFDLTMLNGYNYYTGIVFRGYTYGTGEAVIKGGRYNNLLAKFGKEDAPSIGFAIFVDSLMLALQRQNIIVENDGINYLVLYTSENQKDAITLGIKLRENEIKTELIRKSKRHEIAEYIEYAKKNSAEKIFYFTDEPTELIKVIDVVNGTESEVAFDDITF